MSSLYITELDVLDNLDEIKICRKYKLGDQELDGALPTIIDDFGKLVPEYKTLPGWKQDITEIEDFDKLPTNA